MGRTLGEAVDELERLLIARDGPNATWWLCKQVTLDEPPTRDEERAGVFRYCVETPGHRKLGEAPTALGAVNAACAEIITSARRVVQTQ